MKHLISALNAKWGTYHHQLSMIEEGDEIRSRIELKCQLITLAIIALRECDKL